MARGDDVDVVFYHTTSYFFHHKPHQFLICDMFICVHNDVCQNVADKAGKLVTGKSDISISRTKKKYKKNM
jgi:hypothetical protein